MKLQDSVIVVTGAAGGIGEALVAAFVADKAQAIVAHDRDAATVAEVARRHEGKGTVVLPVTGDVSSQTAIEEVVATVEQRFGRIDLFCSNAGVMFDGGLELPTELWNQAWAVNVMAHVHAARAVTPGMLRRGSGHLLSVCSAAGMLTAPGAAPYAVTKHAALGLAEWLAITYGDRGIGVSVVCPEAVDTQMLAASLAAGNAGVQQVAKAGAVVEASAVATATVDGLKAGRFLITTHPNTLKNTQRKWADPDRWLVGMRTFLRGQA